MLTLICLFIARLRSHRFVPRMVIIGPTDTAISRVFYALTKNKLRPDPPLVETFNGVLPGAGVQIEINAVFGSKFNDYHLKSAMLVLMITGDEETNEISEYLKNKQLKVMKNCLTIMAHADRKDEISKIMTENGYKALKMITGDAGFESWDVLELAELVKVTM